MMGERPPRRPGIEREEVVITRGDPRRDDDTIPAGSKLVTWHDLNAWQRASREEMYRFREEVGARLDQLIADSQAAREYRHEREERERRRDQNERVERDSERVRRKEDVKEAFKERLSELSQLEAMRDASHRRRIAWAGVLVAIITGISVPNCTAITSQLRGQGPADRQTVKGP